MGDEDSTHNSASVTQCVEGNEQWVSQDLNSLCQVFEMEDMSCSKHSFKFDVHVSIFWTSVQYPNISLWETKSLIILVETACYNDVIRNEISMKIKCRNDPAMLVFKHF